ncbi:MAG: amidohydrolase family protein, partial [Bacteroidota bacterium]
KDFGDAYVMEAPDKNLIGKSFTQIAAERQQDPVDTFLDLVVEMDKEILWETTVGNQNPDDYGPLYNDPNVVFGFADSGAHINNMAFYNLAIRVLRYVQASHDKGNPLMSYEKAIWRLTKENADFFNIDAGHLAVGKRADLNILDPEKLSDKVHEYHTAEFLQGCERLVNRSEDVIELTMINGKIAVEQGEFAESFGKERFGQFLKGQHEGSGKICPQESTIAKVLKEA